MKDLVIYGAGGLAREMASLIDDVNSKRRTWNLLGFLEDYEENHGKILNDVKIIGGLDFIEKNEKELYVVFGMADTGFKKELDEKITNPHIKYATIIHPTAQISRYSEIAEGCVIQANVTITVNCKIGRHSFLNIGTIVGHDTIIGNYCSIMPRTCLSGNVNVGERSYFGCSSTVIQKKNIGENAIIGANACVVKDIPGNCTAVGIPAKPIKFNK